MLVLANEVMGCHFVPEVHGELFDQMLKAVPDKPLTQWDTIKDRLILWPRNHYKTTALTVAIIYLIINCPEIQICVMRSTLIQSRKWLKEIAEQFTGERPGSRFREVFPEFCGDKKALHLTANKFETCAQRKTQGREPTVYVASFTSDTTGDHYDVGFFDDLVTKDNYKNPTQLNKVIDGFHAITPQVNPGGYRFCSGTRYAHGDLYDDIMRTNSGNWRVSVKDCWKDGDPAKGPLFPQQMVKILTTGVMKEVGFTKELLLQYMHDKPEMFSCQYLNRPAVDAIGQFSESQFNDAKIDPKTDIALSQAVLFVDLAATTTSRSDDSVILCGKMDSTGHIYLVDGIGDRWEPQALANHVIAMTLKHRPLKVMLENTASCKYFVEVLRMLATDCGVTIPVDFLPVDNKPDAKTIRVKGVSSFLNRGRLKIFSNLPCWEKLLKQFLTFTGERGTHDDYPDTVALMCNFFVGTSPRQPPPPKQSANAMIDLLMRDIQADEMRRTANQQPDLDAYAGGMGSDFAC